MDTNSITTITRSGNRTALRIGGLAMMLAAMLLAAPSVHAQSGSCSNGSSTFCGGKSSGSCYCDPACMEFGDCCSDYNQVCDDNGGTPPPLGLQCTLKTQTSHATAGGQGGATARCDQGYYATGGGVRVRCTGGGCTNHDVDTYSFPGFQNREWACRYRNRNPSAAEVDCQVRCCKTQ